MDILGNVDDNGSRTAGSRYSECGGDDIEQITGRPDKEIVLGDGHAQPIRVHLLEGIGADHGLRHLARDADDGNGVELGVRNGRQSIGGPRPGRGKENRGVARDPSHALGNEPGPLLMARQDMPDRGPTQRVIQGQVRTAGDTRDSLDTLSLQQLDDDFRTG